MDAGDADEVKAFGGEAPGDGFPGIGSLLEKGEAREIREVERERSRGVKEEKVGRGDLVVAGCCYSGEEARGGSETHRSRGLRHERRARQGELGANGFGNEAGKDGL